MKYSVLEYLEETATAFGDKTAVIDEEGSCTWGELRAVARQIGSALTAHVDTGAPIPVLMDKSITTLAIFMGSIYCGAFYTLLNPELPASRLLQILSVLDAKVLVTDSAHQELAEKLLEEMAKEGKADRLPKLLTADELLGAAVDEKMLEQRGAEHIDTDPLYANFTSGSTGVPKGVVVGHRSVLDFIDQYVREFGIDHTDIIANQAPFDFDVSVKDIYTAMKTGATLVLIPRRLFSNPTGLLDFLCMHEVTTLTWAVSALCLVSTFHGLEYKVPDKIRRILFSGEVMPLKHLRYWMTYLPDTQFVNLYGPTEITCNCTFHRIDRKRDYENGIPIGRPFANERVFLLDAENHRVTEPGCVGEICVAGSALALGYYNAPEQTAAAFCLNPLRQGYPELMYRTGDLGSYDEEGELFFAGRKDFQIKYMGHRIELEEIERAMAKLPQIIRVCCVFDQEKERLYGFYQGDTEAAQLHEAMQTELPEYMIPGRLLQVEEMPLTKNGKIDRKALLELGRTSRRRRRG